MQTCLVFLIIKKNSSKNRRILFTCEKWLVTTLTAINKIWVCLNHKTRFQPRPHMPTDFFLSFNQATKPLVSPDSMNRWTNFSFSAEDMLQFKGTSRLRLIIPLCITKVKSTPLDNNCLLLPQQESSCYPVSPVRRPLTFAEADDLQHVAEQLWHHPEESMQNYAYPDKAI